MNLVVLSRELSTISGSSFPFIRFIIYFFFLLARASNYVQFVLKLVLFCFFVDSDKILSDLEVFSIVSYLALLYNREVKNVLRGTE